MSRRNRIVPLTPEQRRQVLRDPRLADATESRYAAAGWRARGSCLDKDPETFFPGSHEPVDAALKVCSTCPVQGSCLAAALDAGDYDGVWGGTTPEERRAMRQVWPLQVARADAG